MLRLWIFNEIDSALKSEKEVWVKLESGQYSNFIIELLKISGKNSWVKFSGCDSSEDAGLLNGLQFSILRSNLTSLYDKEFYLTDLIGFNVIDKNQNSIGLVADTMILPAQNLLVVETNGKEVLIPFVDAHVKLFDKKDNIIILKNVEGLLN